MLRTGTSSAAVPSGRGAKGGRVGGCRKEEPAMRHDAAIRRIAPFAVPLALTVLVAACFGEPLVTPRPQPPTLAPTTAPESPSAEPSTPAPTESEPPEEESVPP